MTAEKEIIEQRIFIGNVDYKATEDELKSFFDGYKVTDVDIPSKPVYRGKKVHKRHLGFAFVEFGSKEEADKAIEEFNNKSFKDRNIYVKKAVTPPSEEEKQKKIEEIKSKKAELKAKKSEESKPIENGEASESKTSKKKKNNKKKSKATVTEDLEESKTEEKAEAPKAKEGASDEASDKKVPDGKPSQDTIFITNLDYKIDVKTLSNIFKDLKPKWIHVPTRRVPFHVLKRQRRKGKSIFNKGIAFVKFSSEEVQKKALADFNGKELNGRQIIVDIAVDARVPEVDDADSKEEDNAEDGRSNSKDETENKSTKDDSQ